MYNDENYENDDTEEEQSSGSKIKEIYENNKKLVWVLGIIIILIIVASIFSGKNGSSTSGGSSAYVKTVNNPETVQLSRAKELKLMVNNKEYVGSIDSSKFAFTPQNKNIAYIDSSGMINGVGIGSTVIKGSYTESGKQYTFDVNVVVFNGNKNIKLQSVDFNGRSIIMNDSVHEISLGSKLNVTPDDGYVYDIMYSSSDPTIATVDEFGVVRGLKPGHTTITAYVNERSMNASIDVYVISDILEPEIIKIPQKIEFEAGASTKIPIGGVLTELKLSLSPSDSSSKYISWKSSDENIVQVTEEGMVSGIKEGTATITATALNGKQGKIIVEASQDVTDIDSISIVPSSITLKSGESKVITPTIKPDNAGTKSLSFESNNPSVASVVPNSTKTSATIYAGTNGTAVITVKSANGKIATVTVTVSSSPPPCSGSGCGDSDSGTIRVRLGGDSNVPGKACDGKAIDYFKGPIDATITGSASYVSYCFGKDCKPDDSKKETLNGKTVTVTPTIPDGVTLILRVKKYNSKGNEIASSNSGNYINGALEYYINTKSSGLVCKSRSDWENVSTITTVSKGACYVSTSTSSVGNNFVWKDKGDNMSSYSNLAETVITTEENCKKANNNNNGTRNLCFRVNGVNKFGAKYSVKSAYPSSLYVSTISSQNDCEKDSTTKKLSSVKFYIDGVEKKSTDIINIKVGETKDITISLNPSEVDNAVTVKSDGKKFTIDNKDNITITKTKKITIKGTSKGLDSLEVSGDGVTEELNISVTDGSTSTSTLKSVEFYNNSNNVVITDATVNIGQTFEVKIVLEPSSINGNVTIKSENKKFTVNGLYQITANGTKTVTIKGIASGDDRLVVSDGTTTGTLDVIVKDNSSSTLKSVTFKQNGSRIILANVEKDKTITIQVELNPSQVNDAVTIKSDKKKFTVNGLYQITTNGTKTVTIKGIASGDDNLVVSDGNSSKFSLGINVFQSQSQQT